MDATATPRDVLLTWQDIADAATGLEPAMRELLLEIVREKGITLATSVITAEGPWYVRSVRVRGHIGVGQQPVELSFTPAPGLTLITARNGTGKTSVADGLRHNLSGGSQRAYQVLADNVHCGDREILVTVTNGHRDVEIVCGSDKVVSWRDSAGMSATPPVEWAEAFARYMPVLLYPEVSQVIQDPGNLHSFLKDALELGALEELQARLKPVREAGMAARRELDRTFSTAVNSVHRSGRPDLESLLRSCGSAADPDTVQHIRALVGDLADTAPPPPSLPELWQDDSVRRSGAVSALQRLAGARAASLPGAAAVRDALARLLDHDNPLLTRNREHDVCPLCQAGGRGWVEIATSTRIRLDETTDAIGVAETAAAKALANLTSCLPPALPASLREALHRQAAPAYELRIKQWDRLAHIAADLSPYTMSAETLTMVLDECADLAVWYAPIREQLFAVRDEAIAAQATIKAHIELWIETLTGTRPALARLAVAERLNRRVDTWLRTSREEIFGPIGTQVKQLWAVLNSDTDLRLIDIALTGGTQRQRSVALALADGDVVVPAGRNSSAVLSTGQRNALSLATYLPRATQPESPFGFLILDDPIHAFDTWRVRYLAAHLLELATRFQVVVFTHDDRLWREFRAFGARPTHMRMDRRGAPQPQVRISHVTSPGAHLLDDLQEMLDKEARKPIGTPEATTAMTLALCRQALDTEVVTQIEIMARRIKLAEAKVAEDLRAKRKTREQLGLLNEYAQRAGIQPVPTHPYDQTIRALNGGSHGRVPNGDLQRWVRDTREIIRVVNGIGG
ncbi:hypothetical protein QEZ54_20440 [Catellatospora sp. KI3]|uniref:hypothetical protein n=1 Tax=Catellatospora sp. KI3 TaxID=3041620 RepID=UPI0024832155|nr:hypothetical protein [Catellatospora sp. KI3]MDI1463355.1 hypothetical protein [Catellatospora sp. KI3]